jgi:hypothetical protein
MSISQAPLTPAAPASSQRPTRRPVFGMILMILAGLLAIVFIAIQFIPVNRTNPTVSTPIKWNSPETEALARRACMDCHSNETVWPWYANIAPASWLVYYDVQQGRSRLNFSTMAAGVGPRGFENPTNDLAFQIGRLMAGGGSEGGPGEAGRGFNPPAGGQRPTLQPGQTQPSGQFPGGRTGGRGSDIADQIQKGNMPPANYLLIHPAAKLSDAEKKLLIDGLSTSLGTAAR